MAEQVPAHWRRPAPGFVPAHWVRVASLVDASGWPAVLVLAGRPVSAAGYAEAEVPALEAAGAEVLWDAAGHPYVDPGGPGALAWARDLAARVGSANAAIERGIQEALNSG